MLPAKHFNLFDKSMETLKSSTEATLDSKSKNIIEIKENAIDKNAKTSTDDEYDDEYDYYGDSDNDSDEVVPITPKSVTITTCKFQFFQFSNCAPSIFHESG